MTDLIRTLRETIHYPPHEPRHPTAQFSANHKAMVIDEDQPCHICTVRHSILIDPVKRDDPTLNRRGAIQIESHHFYCEDSLANAVDPARWNARLLPYLRHKDPVKYAQPFTAEQVIAWIHGDRDNLMTLCDVCHRHPLVGVHAVTHPVWSVADLLREDFDLTGFVAHSPAEAAALTALPQTVGAATAPDVLPAEPAPPAP